MARKSSRVDQFPVLLLLATGGKAASFHVHQPRRAMTAVDDEVQALERVAAELRSPRLVDGDVRHTPSREYNASKAAS